MQRHDPSNAWDPAVYEERARFVREGGGEVLELLAPRAGERILDLGCGPGKLTRQLADRGASVVGLDSSPSMLAEARASYPELEFVLGRGEALPFDAEFDAIFSNAALHWMPRAGDVAEGMKRALRAGGRLALEFGGYQNIAAVREAVGGALSELGLETVVYDRWYFPKLGEYAALLESAGFLVRFARWFPRPSPMPDSAEQTGLEGWLRIFASDLVDALPEQARPRFFQAAAARARAKLHRDGTWWLDYVRLRIEAVLPD